MADETVSDKLEANAKGPSFVQSDQLAVRQHDLAQQIAADKYLKAQQITNPFDAIWRSRIVPGDCR